MEQRLKSSELEERIELLVSQTKCEFDKTKNEQYMKIIKELSAEYHKITGKYYSIKK